MILGIYPNITAPSLQPRSNQQKNVTNKNLAFGMSSERIYEFGLEQIVEMAERIDGKRLTDSVQGSLKKLLGSDEYRALKCKGMPDSSSTSFEFSLGQRGFHLGCTPIVTHTNIGSQSVPIKGVGSSVHSALENLISLAERGSGRVEDFGSI